MTHDEKDFRYRVYACVHPGAPMVWMYSSSDFERAQAKARDLQSKGMGTDILKLYQTWLMPLMDYSAMKAESHPMQAQPAREE
jgi:hypothetical protein